MKKSRTIYAVSIAVGFCIIFMSLAFIRAQDANPNRSTTPYKLSVRASTPKQNYVTGEIIDVGIEVTNASESDITLGGADIKSGYVLIFISTSKEGFRQYIPGGVRVKTPRIVIQQGKTIQSETTIFWNAVHDTAGLSDYAIRSIQNDQLMTNYAFPKAGTYYVKAVLIIPGETMAKIESQPIPITVNDSLGDDLEIWNLIKDDGDVGYFMQYGSVRNPHLSAEARAEFEVRMEQIAVKFPSGVHAERIRQSLAKYEAAELRRKGFQENLKKPAN